jgi:hydroxymethylbilane synthase
VLLRISARKSDLARLQAKIVGQTLQKKFPELQIQFQFRESLGDRNLQDPLWKMPEKGVFTEDFYKDLIEETTDMVVHSWKDLPTEGKSDTVIAATLPRADQRDLLLMKKDYLKSSSISILSSSPRRAHNLQKFLTEVIPGVESPDQIHFENVRGNIPTRVRKLVESSEHQGLILAKAAVDRLLTTYEGDDFREFDEVRGILQKLLKDLNFMVLPLSVNPNAAAQGALAIEIKAGRLGLLKYLDAINDQATFVSVQIERDRLAAHGGGCHQKIGVASVAQKYGQILFEKGLTQSGETLSAATIIHEGLLPSFKAQSLFCPQSSERTRESLVLTAQDLIKIKSHNLWIARHQAWPEDLPASAAGDNFIWAAGVKTWKALAQRGLWVHGCADSLGDWRKTAQELEILGPVFSHAKEWLRLTHKAAAQDNRSLATYSVVDEVTLDKLSPEHKFFFWKSGVQFRQALARYDFLRERYHASGPGGTHKALLEELPSQKVFVFYDEKDWRAQCQTSRN